MKFLSDFFSLLLFFAVYFIAGHYPDAALHVAQKYLLGLTRDGAILPDLVSISLATTAAFMAAALQITFMLALRKKVSVAQWLSFFIFLIFGGATIYFQSDTFIKWKPTVLYWIFAVMLFAGEMFFQTNLIRKLMGSSGLDLPAAVWQWMNRAWMIFFVAVGVLNLYIAFNFSRDVWVGFKSFGLTVLTLLFALGIGLYLSRHIKDESAPESSAPP